MSEYSKLPWKVGKGLQHKIYSVTEPELDEICRCYGSRVSEANSNAELIVKAVNSYADNQQLIKELKGYKVFAEKLLDTEDCCEVCPVHESTCYTYSGTEACKRRVAKALIERAKT